MTAARATSALLFAAVLVSAAPARAQESRSSGSLEQAYKREFAFLEAEKRALSARIAAKKKAAAERAERARAEIAALQGRVVAAASEADRLAETSLEADREIEGLDQGGDIVGDVVERASTAYGDLGVELPEADPERREELLAQLRFAFDKAPEVLAEQARVRRRRGAYFDAAGNKVEGEILEIGNVASYGLAPGAEGALAPAGEGRLKLWPAADAGAAARALGAGERPATLPIFLYESTDKGVEPRHEKSVREIIDAGGVIGWVIVALGFLALAMVILRAGFIAAASLGTRKVVGPVLDRLAAGHLEEAIELASRGRGAAARVIAATLRNLDKDREQLEDVVAEAVLAEQPRLSRFGTSILVVAAVSPLLGLLGTVTGMISTFEIITEFGTGNPKLLSGGISEALVTTELGLIVAIPALLLGHILSGLAERSRDGLDAAALAAVNRASGLRVEDALAERAPLASTDRPIPEPEPV